MISCNAEHGNAAEAKIQSYRILKEGIG